MNRLVILGASVAVVLGLTGCYTVPETGRSAFILPLGSDVAQGAAAFSDIKSKEKISRDPVVNERVNRIGRRIADAVGSDLPGAEWEFVVFDAPKTVNAFALPGGKVGVYTGLLNLAADDDELAFVMGHEIAHVTARHGAQRMSQGVLAAGLGVLLDAGTRDKGSHDTLLAGYGLLAGGTMLAFSREHESEADYIGLRYSAKAGYDPRASTMFWKKMAAQNKGGGLPEFMRTHPSDERRIANLERLIPAALPLYQAAKSRYQ